MTQRSVEMTGSASGEIDRALLRLDRLVSLPALAETWTFAPTLEHRFNVDTAQVRARELRPTMWFGLFLYELTNVMDGALIPDLGLRGVVLRLLLTPLLVLASLYIPDLPSLARERMLAIFVIVCTLCLTFIIGRSHSPYAPYGLASVSLCVIYANTTHPLRFKFACCNSLITVGSVALTIYGYHQIHTGLALSLNLMSVGGGLFSLVANYRLERSTRLNYLLARKGLQHIEDLAKEREMLSILSQTDRLTGLANRVRLERWSDGMFNDPSNIGLPVAMLMIDIDHFKRFNDHYGHGAGDDCLREVAGILAGAVQGRRDLAVRYGGEEFIVLLSAVTAAEAVDVAHRIQANIEQRGLVHANRDDGVAVVTVSIGVAHAAVRPGSQLSVLMSAADRELYKAKKKGRNRVESACGPALAEAC